MIYEKPEVYVRVSNSPKTKKKKKQKRKKEKEKELGSWNLFVHEVQKVGIKNKKVYKERDACNLFFCKTLHRQED